MLLNLKQMSGRLIRSEDDRGLVVIVEPRREKRLLPPAREALPPGVPIVPARAREPARICCARSGSGPTRAPMSALVGRTAVVTGAGTGIGRAIALRLARRGASVALLGRTRATPRARRRRGEGRDAGAPRSTCAIAPPSTRAFDAAANRFGKLHLLVANAGIGGPDDRRRRGPLRRDRPHEPARRATPRARFLRHVAPAPSRGTSS